jgi:alpha-beta hydrolase superfamily lysophospholipase
MAPHLHHPPTDTAEISAADGTRLFLRRWQLTDQAKRIGSALLLHGLGEHGGRYGHVAATLNAAGIEVWAHDHRGFGKSGGDRARIAHRESFIEDAKLVFDKICADENGNGQSEKPVLLGHSMGGAIAARAVTGGWITPRALILSSPGLKSYLNTATRAAVRGLELVSPGLTVAHGLPLDKISHDETVLADAKADPLNHILISPRITMFIVEAGEAAIRDAGKLTMPALVQAAGDDKLVDPDGARAFAAAAPAGLCTLKLYDGLYHEIYNEREADRARVLADMKEWLTRQLAA